MTDSAITPTGLAPAWLLSLQQRLLAAYEIGAPAAVVVAANWLKMPTVADCPTPGQARNWTHDDWKEWAGTHGYVYHSHTAHSFLYRHAVVDHLRFGVSTSPSDWRTPMAMAKDVRTGVRDVADVARAFIVIMAGFGLDPHRYADIAHDEDAIRRTIGGVVTAYLAKRMTKAEVRGALAPANSPANVSAVPLSEDASKLLNSSLDAVGNEKVAVDDVNSRLRVLKNEFDVSPKQALRQIKCYEGDDGAVDATLALLKLCKPGESVTTDPRILGELNDIIDMMREVAKADKEFKRAEREREREAQEVRAKPKTLQEVTQEGVNSRRQTIIDQLHGYEKMAQSLVDRMRLAQTQVPVFPLPEFADPAELAVARCRIEVLEGEARGRDGEIGGLRSQLAEAGNGKALTEQIEAARAFAAVTADTLKGVAQMNPFQMVSALQALQQQAEEIVVKLAPAKEVAA